MVPTAGNGHISSNGPSIPDGSWDREAWPPTNQSDADLVEHASPKESNASIGSRPSLEELDAIVRNQSLDDRNNATIANPQPEETTPETCSVQDNRPAPRGSPIPTKQSHSVVQPRTFGKDSQEISILEKRSSYQRITDFITRFWLFEVGSITVSVAVLIAIAIILKNSDGYQISTGNNEPDNWFFGQLTLNGLIALLSTVVEACMMISVAASISQLKWIHFSARRSMQNGHKLAEFDDMDQASRGARGSLKLLLSRAPQLTSVGAIITIFALAFDTFSQQVIAIESAIGNQTQPADIPAVASYSLYMKNGQEGRFFAPLSITAAIYNGVYDPGNISPSPVQCLTGNCTWSVFPSLAVDGSCTNITDTVIHDCEPTENAYNCTYNVANGSGYSFSQTSSSPLGVGGYHGAEYRLIVNPSFTGSAYNDPHILYILQFLVLDLTGGPGLRAYACGLWLSVHAYNLTMVSGKQTQTFTGIWTKTHYATQKEKGSEAWYSFIDLPTSVSPPNVPETERILDSSILSSNPPNYNFSVYQFAYEGLQAALINVMNASVAYGADSYVQFSNTIAEAFWKVSDWNFWVSSMAQSLTNNLQSTAMIVDPRYKKTVYTTYAYIHVRWTWLAFPTGMVLVSTLFLAVSIFLTAHWNLQPWKDNNLRLLLCDLDRDIETQASNMHLLEDERVVFDPSALGGMFKKIAPLATREPTS